MIRISSIELAVLGLLYEHHHYAYRLEEIMEKRKMNIWADIEFSSIDNTLKMLEENNLVESRMMEEEDEPSRKKVFHITEEGKFVLKENVKKLLSKKGKIIYPINMGFANMNLLSHEELIQSLKLYSKSLEEHIVFLDNSIKVQEENNVPYDFIAVFSHSSALLKAEKKWIEEFILKIRGNV